MQVDGRSKLIDPKPLLTFCSTPRPAENLIGGRMAEKLDKFGEAI
jgi:hypothetical protein